MNKQTIKQCEICGVTQETKNIQWVGRVNMYLCSKHKKQIYEYGKITDPTPRTQQDKNEIIMHDSYAEIVIRDRKNVIMCKAIIDIDDVERVKQYKWGIDSRHKDKNRNGYIATGTKDKRITLHRFILNYNGPLQVDHINRNKYDNRKKNLRIVTNITNSQNTDAKNIRFVNGKYRVEIIRFGKLYNFGGFNSYEEALNKKEQFIKDIDNNREYIEKTYREKQPKIKNIRYTENKKYIVNIHMHGKHLTIERIQTLEDAINIKNKIITELKNN